MSMIETSREKIEEIKYEQFKLKMKESNIEELIIRS